MHMIVSLRNAPETTHARRSVLLFVLVTIQAIIGIMTLVLQVPVGWGVAHQGGALVVLGFAVAHWRAFVGEYPQPAGDRSAGLISAKARRRAGMPARRMRR